MGRKSREITQGFCVLVLALSLSFATALPVTGSQSPSISPTTAQYNLDDPAEIVSAITWNGAANIVSVRDNERNLTPGLGGDYIVLVKHLIILNSYLENKLARIGDSVQLNVKFDVGAATLNITSIGTRPSMSPTTAEYNLDGPRDVSATVTWGIATSVASIVDDDGYNLVSGNHYTVTNINNGAAANVTIRSDTYLAGKLTDIGHKVVLNITFNRGNSVTLTITAIGTHPSISPTTAQYNVDNPADVETTITWGAASSVASIVDDGGYTLTSTDYTVTPMNNGLSASLSIRSSPYLAGKLTDIGDKVVLTIKFNLGNNGTFEITATGVNAALSPQTRAYDLDNPADVTTTIMWGTATSVTSIVDDDGHALTGTEYTLTPVTPGLSANLTILNDSYLAGKLKNIGDKVVLTIKFNLGTGATFTITATGIQPTISPPTYQYDLDSPADAVATVTWGTATAIVSIVDDDRYTLVEGSDYTLSPISLDDAALTVLAEPYLQGKRMGIGDTVVLTVKFDIGADATFTITATGIHPSISPITATHNIIEENDVTIEITWHSATSVVSIMDDKGYRLEEGVDYIITPSTTGISANLTILGSEYLARRLKSFGDKVVLNISFDVGKDANVTITVPGVCFIATAAYGTPMAQEIQVLREFRDHYLLSNPVGQAMVSLYYKISPPIAAFIAEHASLKPIVRAGLLPAVAMSTVAVNTTPFERTLIVCLLVLVSVAVAIRVTTRRRRGPEYN